MDYELLCNKVTSIVRLAANFIRKEAMQFDANLIEYKGLNDMVSYVDKTAEEMLVHNLEKILPEAGFLTEEKTSSKIGKTYMWIIDPLDGTTNFIHGIPTYAVSVALYEDNSPVLGVVYEINKGEMFYSYKGGPAFLNRKEIVVSSTSTLSNSLLATGFPYYQFEYQTQYLNVLAELMQQTHGLRRMGSAAVDLVYTACGRFDAYFEYNIQPWDIAAGCFIVEQAGGNITDFSGANQYLNKKNVIASNGLLTDELFKVIHKHFNA